MRLPEPIAGVRWVVPEPADAVRIHALYDAWAEASGQTWRESLEEITHDMEAPTTDLAADWRFAEDAEGRFVASVAAYLRSVPSFKHRAFLFTTSRPGFGHVEAAAVRWGEARARAAFSAEPDRMTEVIRVFSDMGDTARIARFEALGFEIARYFVDMIRPLDRPIPALVFPEGVELHDWADSFVEPTWEAHCEAFADHWGSLPPPLDEWRHRVEGPSFRSDLSLVAVAEGAVVAYALNGVAPDDWERRGRKEGWIETLGTRRSWRRRGLASGLIIASMDRFAADGLDHAALDVDTANASGALGLYERLGFVEIDRTADLVKEFPPA